MRRATRRRAGLLPAAISVAVTVAVTACAAPVSARPASASTQASTSAAVSAAAVATGAAAAAADCDPVASYDPPSVLPAPGHLPNGSTMAKIVARGRLVVGTSGDKPLMAARDPRTGQLGGIDVDLARAVAKALFGTPDAVEFRTIPYTARESVLADGSVDMVAHSMTMTCDRWQKVGFSTEYYRDGQRLLVRSDSPAREVEDLAGRRVCVATGTTTIRNLEQFPALRVVPVEDPGDCLVLFQRGEVDAITSNEIVLLGYAAQDPYARLIGRPLSDEPRGLAFNRDDVDLIRFVNGVLARMRADGELRQILSSRLTPLGRPVPISQPVYGRQP